MFPVCYIMHSLPVLSKHLINECICRGDLIKSSPCYIWVKALKLWLREPSCCVVPLLSPIRRQSFSWAVLAAWPHGPLSAYLCLLMKTHQFLSASSPVLEFKYEKKIVFSVCSWQESQLEWDLCICNGMSVMNSWKLRLHVLPSVEADQDLPQKWIQYFSLWHCQLLFLYHY